MPFYTNRGQIKTLLNIIHNDRYLLLFVSNNLNLITVGSLNISINQGVKQGCSMSIINFNNHIDDLVKKWKTTSEP